MLGTAVYRIGTMAHAATAVCHGPGLIRRRPKH